MKRLLIIAAAFAAMLASCRQVEPEMHPDPAPVRIDPVITKVTDVNFENGDVLGLCVTRAQGVYAENAPLTYDGTEFRGDLCWYLEPDDPSEIAAYYPYDASGVPETFTVQTDQSAGISSSDFITASKSEVYPSFNSVSLAFKHRLTKIALTLANLSGSTISKVELDGLTPVAKVNVADGSVQADTLADKVAISACNVAVDTFWKAIVVPQTAQMRLKVTLSDGKELVQKLAEISMVPSTQYAISAVVYNDNVKIITSGQIEPWLDGGDIPGADDPILPPKPVFEEHLEEGYFIYHDVSYPVVKLKDNKYWMAANMRYLPKGYTPGSSTDDLYAGIYFPLVLNETGTDLEFSSDDADIEYSGYLYSGEVALGVAVDAIRSEEEAKALEGAQGICPEGWHIPTLDDYLDLVGKGAQVDTRPDAPYYDKIKGNCLISLLNADGFNMHSYGYLTIQYATDGHLTMKLSGYLTANPGRFSSGFFAGSSFKSASTTGEDYVPMFHGLMPFESNNTCNVSGVKASNCTPIRCVRN